MLIGDLDPGRAGAKDEAAKFSGRRKIQRAIGRMEEPGAVDLDRQNRRTGGQHALSGLAFGKFDSNKRRALFDEDDQLRRRPARK